MRVIRGVGEEGVALLGGWCGGSDRGWSEVDAHAPVTPRSRQDHHPNEPRQRRDDGHPDALPTRAWDQRDRHHLRPWGCRDDGHGNHSRWCASRTRGGTPSSPGPCGATRGMNPTPMPADRHRDDARTSSRHWRGEPLSSPWEHLSRSPALLQGWVGLASMSGRGVMGDGQTVARSYRRGKVRTWRGESSRCR